MSHFNARATSKFSKKRILILGSLLATSISTPVAVSLITKNHTNTQTQVSIALPPQPPEQGHRANNNATEWQTITFSKSDTLSKVFNTLQINPEDLKTILKTSSGQLTHLKPKSFIRIKTQNHHVLEIQYPISVDQVGVLKKVGTHYKAHQESLPYTTTLAYKKIPVRRSILTEAKHAGLSMGLYHQLMTIFQNSINFKHDLHHGDYFSILYEEKYINGEKAGDGKIVAAEFVTPEKNIRAIHYTFPSHHDGYFTPKGQGMAPLFLSTPVHYKRISSHFTYHRFDPVVHRVQAHLGVDFSTQYGTPITSIGSGKVTFVGRENGYGNTIKVQYGQHYSALYGHMSRFAKIHSGQTVQKGQVIGYVGSTGWATGPHLHFSFFVDGKPRDWLAFKQPHDAIIPKSQYRAFLAEAKKLMNVLSTYQGTKLADNSAHDLTKEG